MKRKKFDKKRLLRIVHNHNKGLLLTVPDAEYAIEYVEQHLEDESGRLAIPSALDEVYKRLQCLEADQRSLEERLTDLSDDVPDDVGGDLSRITEKIVNLGNDCDGFDESITELERVVEILEAWRNEVTAEGKV